MHIANSDIAWRFCSTFIQGLSAIAPRRYGQFSTAVRLNMSVLTSTSSNSRAGRQLPDRKIKKGRFYKLGNELTQALGYNSGNNMSKLTQCKTSTKVLQREGQLSRQDVHGAKDAAAKHNHIHELADFS